MNILMLNREMDVGGGNTFLRCASEALRQRGHRTILFSAGGEMRERMISAFDAVHIGRATFPWEIRRLSTLIREERIDVLNAHALVQLPLVIRACRSTGTPIVLTLAAPFAARRIARFLPAADRIMVMNEYQRTHFLNMGVRPDRMFRSYWIMDWDVYASHAQPWESRRYDAIYCSRLSSTKGPLAVAFIEAVRRLLPDHPRITIAIVGSGRHLPQVQDAARRLDREAGRTACRIESDILDTGPLFGSARIVAGGNYVCIEAMAAGAQAIGAGYDGVYGLVTGDNLDEAAEQYFGDHMTPITGVDRDDRLLVDRFAEAIRTGLQSESTARIDARNARAQAMFRREEGIEMIEREFAAVARSNRNAAPVPRPFIAEKENPT